MSDGLRKPSWMGHARLTAIDFTRPQFCYRHAQDANGTGDAASEEAGRAGAQWVGRVLKLRLPMDRFASRGDADREKSCPPNPLQIVRQQRRRVLS